MVVLDVAGDVLVAFEVDIIYVDYGNREQRVGPARLRPLPRRFAKLPAYAFPSALHQVCG